MCARRDRARSPRRRQGTRAELATFGQVRVPEGWRIVEGGGGVPRAGPGENRGGEENGVHNEGTKLTALPSFLSCEPVISVISSPPRRASGARPPQPLRSDPTAIPSRPRCRRETIRERRPAR